VAQLNVRQDLMRIPTIYFMLATVTFAAGQTFVYNTLTNENHPVQVAVDAKKTFTITRAIALMDGLPPTAGLILPKGIYALEAEDSEYWYLRSPAPLKFRESKDGIMVGGRTASGGIVIRKRKHSDAPFGAYVDGEGQSKVLVWKFGKGFPDSSTHDWTKDF
jgi:hypothetical protein